MNNDLSHRDASLADPYLALVEDMKTNPEDAAALAEYVDPAVIVAALKKINYDVKRKIEVLGKILEDGTNTEKMRAMRELDTIRETSLAHRGIFVHGAPDIGGSRDPIGLPQSLESLTLTKTTQKATLTMRQQYDALPDDRKSQPLQENPDHDEARQEPADRSGDDTYFEDSRGADPNIFRPATTEHGQRNDNGW